MSTRELVILIVTNLLALGGIVFGSYDPLWHLLNTPDELRGGATLGLSIVILLIGHTLSSSARDDQHDKELKAEFTKFESALKTTLSGAVGLRVFRTAAESAAHVESLLRDATKVWNTRIPAPAHETPQNSEASRYDQLMRPLALRGVFFREVVSVELAARALDLQTRAPNYRCATWARPNSPFFNFIVIEKIDGSREVVFGWMVMPVQQFEQHAFASSNSTLVQHFISMHDLMMTASPAPLSNA